MSNSVTYESRYKFAVTFLLASGLLIASDANAKCQRISTTTTSPTNGSYVDPLYGKTAIWDGAHDPNRGDLNLPIVNISDTAFQPNGTMLASSIVPFITYGQRGGYDPEQVLYRCDAADENEIFEYYSVNADNAYSGMYEDGVADGVNRGYATYIKNVVARLKNNQSGEYFSRIWQKRAMTGLDRDAEGRILVKAKNFTDISVELFRIRDVRGFNGSSAVNRPYESGYSYNQPAGYIAFGGPGITHPTEGIDHISHYPGWYAQWPGNISFYQQMLVRRTPGTCSVSSVAPYVLFPTTTIKELEQGHSVNVNMSLSYRCQGDFISGTKAGNFAVGFKIDTNSFNRAKAMGLTDQAAVSHLLSRNYGSPGYAQGVGVILEREDGLTQPFVIKTYPDLGTGIYDSSKDGWRKFIGTNIDYDPINKVTILHETYTAKLTKIPGVTVTAGKYYAQAQVLIRVQ